MLNWTYFHLESRGRSRHVWDHLDKKYYRYYSPIVGHMITRLKLFNYHQLKGQIACVIVLFIAARETTSFPCKSILRWDTSLIIAFVHSAVLWYHYFLFVSRFAARILEHSLGLFIFSAYFLHFSLILPSLLTESL